MGTCALICHSSQSVRRRGGGRGKERRERWMDKGNFRKKVIGEKGREKETEEEEEDFKVLRSLLNTVLMCSAYS